MTTSLPAFAQVVDDAARTATAIAQFAASGGVGLADAYEIQRLSVARRIARGERLTGFKMGLTSRAKMLQVGVDQAIWGRLTDAMLVDEGGEIEFASYIHPRAEPEIAFILKRDLAGRVTAAEAMLAVECVTGAIEIIDSRFENFKFDVCDVVADNSSAAGYVLGRPFRADLDTSNLGMVMSVDGGPVEIGSSAAILGNPVRALIAAAAAAASTGDTLRAGDVVLAGAATAAVALTVGTRICVEIQRMGVIEVSVNGNRH